MGLNVEQLMKKYKSQLKMPMQSSSDTKSNYRATVANVGTFDVIGKREFKSSSK